MLVTAAVEPHEQPMITAGVAQHRASRISEGAPEGDRTTASYEYGRHGRETGGFCGRDPTRIRTESQCARGLR